MIRSRIQRILATAGTDTYVTKVLTNLWRKDVLQRFSALGLIAAALCSMGASAQSVGNEKKRGPAEALYLQLSDVELDSTRVFRVREAAISRPGIQITLEDGTIAFTKDVYGRVTGAFFEGDGEVLVTPPNDVERKSMSLFTGMAILEERFATAYLRFNDNVVAELQPSFRAAEQPEQFVAHWNSAARNLAQADAMRLLATFSALLPDADGNSISKEAAAKIPESEDRLFHARVQGEKLGVFDVFYDSTAGEQVEAGQTKASEDQAMYYNVWTSFSVLAKTRGHAGDKEVPPPLPAGAESRLDPIFVRRYVVNAQVRPPKELEAEVELQTEILRSGTRCLIFELSRFLHLTSLEADGKAIEFIQNPAVEGTQRARSANDLVAVILPVAATQGQKLTLRFKYGGEVLAEAGKGLLYVGERGTWYPNRGMGMTDFDLTFHYPPGWTLLATGKPAPVANAKSPGTDEQTSRWVTERPIPVAGFNLGKYVEASAHAANVTVETYATAGVERDFPQPRQPSPPVEIKPSSPPPMVSGGSKPSPARNAAKVAENTARAVGYYAQRFGPFPYERLSLTQMPGPDSQGWPGLVFLSSFAFLTPADEENLHMPETSKLIDSLIPAHETAHQYWGDLITWSGYRDQWFSEGLATYCSLMMLQEQNPAGFQLVMDKYRRDLADKNKDGSYIKDAGPVTLGGRLLSSRFPAGYEAISYGRGAWLFHMLRSMLRDAAEKKGPLSEEPFVAGLRKLRERYEGKNVTTRELLDVFAEDLPPSLRYEGKASLDWFLDGWINGTALPRLQLHDVKLTPKGNGVTVSGIIRQKEAPEDLVTSVPVYGVGTGKPAVLLGRVFADGPETPFHLSAPAGTRKLLLDPNQTVLTEPRD